MPARTDSAPAGADLACQLGFIRPFDVTLALSECCADGVSRSDMVERYHFRLRGPSEVIEDEEGVLASSIEVAVAEATQLIAEMHARGELPDPDERWCVEIHTADGVVLRSLQLY
ncbi:hypothetical protein ME121_2207 [Methylobacterium sp. ME121]|nr:hypothetical protein ME121_2207 [Methylobacterium sp. ME121]GEN01677.1 hypothetical protein MRA01_62160 [Methylobacterium radiotolerans]